MTPLQTVIHFTCHSCGMALTVPAEIAGISGPCPNCSAMITSPVPAAQAPPAVIAPNPQVAPPAYHAPARPAYVPPAPVPGPVPAVAPSWQAAPPTAPIGQDLLAAFADLGGAQPAAHPPVAPQPGLGNPSAPVPPSGFPPVNGWAKETSAAPQAPAPVPSWLPLGTPVGGPLAVEAPSAAPAPANPQVGRPAPAWPGATAPVAVPPSVPVAVPKPLDPTPTVVPKDWNAWQPPPSQPTASEQHPANPAWPGSMPTAAAPHQAPEAQHRPAGNHTVLSQVLQAPTPASSGLPLAGSGNAPSAPAPAAQNPFPGFPGLLPTAPQAGAEAGHSHPPAPAGSPLPNPWAPMPQPGGADVHAAAGLPGVAGTAALPGADGARSQPHGHAQLPLAGSRTVLPQAQSAIAPQSANRQRRYTSADPGKKAAMLGSLFMAALVVAGIGWFFRDQLRVAYYSYVAQRHMDEETTEPTPAPSPQATPTSSTDGQTTPSPTPSSAGGQSGNATFTSETNPPPAPASTAVTPETPGTPPSVRRAELPSADPLSALPPTQSNPGADPMSNPGPPVTVLPPLATGADALAKPSDLPQPGTSQALAPVPSTPSAPVPPAYPSRASAPIEVVENATPETQGAVEVLKKFLSAPDAKSRASFVQTPDRIRATMEQYYQQNPSTPIQVRQIALLRHDKNPNTGGGPHCVFQISGGDLKQPIPVMVEQDDTGWKVDWLTFTEFKDDLLQKFLAEYHDEPRRFHVMMRRTHHFDGDIPTPDMACYEVQPPMPGFSEHVFVPIHSRIVSELDNKFGWGMDRSPAVVQLQWRKQDGRQWVELTSVPQYNWRNPAAPKVPVKAELVE